MTNNIVRFPGITKLDIDPDVILSAAAGKTDTVVVVGYNKEGELYFASSVADGGAVLWLMELAKKALLEVIV